MQHLLTDARQAINASNAQLALEHVVQALRLLRGNHAVLPALRAAAEQYHAQQAAPIDELSQLLARVSIAAAQEAPAGQHMQQQMGFAALQQPQPQPQGLPWQQVQQQQPLQQQQQLPQQQVHWPQQAPHQQQQHQHIPGQGAQAAIAAAEASSRPILEESGRGDFAQAAMADGSSWQCPHCSGVVPVQRQQAHLAFWCPTLQQQKD